jgi:hypothetical protein
MPYKNMGNTQDQPRCRRSQSFSFCCLSASSDLSTYLEPSFEVATSEQFADISLSSFQGAPAAKLPDNYRRTYRLESVFLEPRFPEGVLVCTPTFKAASGSSSFVSVTTDNTEPVKLSSTGLRGRVTR